ncbi:MAG: serine hydrolase domain-containing protein [Planctomycetota bacterium]
MKSISTFVALCVLVSLGPTSAPAQDVDVSSPIEIPSVAPEQVGMSSEKLAEVSRVMRGYVEDQKMVGGIVLIARKGKVCFFEAYGQADRESNRPMRKDSILRFYSMTKSITTAAALMLCDEGKLSVEDPVSKYVPELATLNVISDEGDQPAIGAMTIADLMRHSSGLSYGWSGDRLAQLHNERNLLDAGNTLEQMVGKMENMPVRFEPGSGWEYSVATDVLGRVVEVVSQQPFDTFLQKRVFDPLDMRDTGFYVPADKRSRFAACYSGQLARLKEQDQKYENAPAFKSGGGGLVSTARDYMRFLMMIERGGVFGGKRYLQPETVKSMRTNQLSESVGWIRFGAEVREGVGFGFGFSVREKMSDWDPHGRVGEYGWGGAASTHYWISPKDELIVITLEQVMPYRWLTEFGLKKQIYDAIID